MEIGVARMTTVNRIEFRTRVWMAAGLRQGLGVGSGRGSGRSAQAPRRGPGCVGPLQSASTVAAAAAAALSCRAA